MVYTYILKGCPIMPELCTFCLAEATDFFEFKTDNHSFYAKGEIKAVCGLHLATLISKGY
jgi:hypothetical protein